MTHGDRNPADHGDGNGGAHGAEGVWVTVAEAARRLGVTPTAIRNRIERGTLESRPHGNHGRLVRLPDGVQHGDDTGSEPGVLTREARAAVAIARLEERLAAAAAMQAELRQQVEALVAELRRELAEVKGDRDHWRTLAEAERERVDRLLATERERAAVQRQRPARRPWPGLRAMWRRLIEGGG